MKYAEKMILVPDTLKLRAKKKTDKLAKSIRMRNQAKVKQWLITPTPPGVVPNAPNPVATPKELSVSLPPMYQAKGQRLLEEMLNAGFTWTPSKELVMPSTETIANSNVENLLKEALVRGKSTSKPIGWDKFISEISQSSIPISLLTKKSTRQALQPWEVY